MNTDLPKLRGSTKQIEWAEKLRAKVPASPEPYEKNWYWILDMLFGYGVSLSRPHGPMGNHLSLGQYLINTDRCAEFESFYRASLNNQGHAVLVLARAMAPLFHQWLLTHDKASWWIDTRESRRAQFMHLDVPWSQVIEAITTELKNHNLIAKD